MLSYYWTGFKKILSFAKKIFIVFIVYVTVISLFVHFFNKDKPRITQDPLNQSREKVYKFINNPQLNKTNDGKLQVATFRVMLCGMIGEGCNKNINSSANNFNNSIIGYLSKAIVTPFVNPPASGVMWAYSSLQNAHLVPTAYAAEGIGFATLKPFMNLWKIFRNLAYMLLVLILIAIGFMIMFRAKINPQTVISIENALPRIIISLILITFSYAIAGFLIDLMYVIIALSIALLSNNGGFYDVGKFQNQYLNSNIPTIWDSLFAVKIRSITGSSGAEIPFFGGFTTIFYIGDAIAGIFPHIVNDVFRLIILLLSVIYVLPPLMNLLGQNDLADMFNDINILGNSLGHLVKPISGWFTRLVIMIAVIPWLLIHGIGYIIGILVFLTMVFLIIRIVALLIKAYLQVILMIVFAPIFLLFEAIPGKSAFSFWFKGLIAELITFPVVVILFVIGYIIVNSLPAQGQTVWAPPLLGGIEPNAFTVILGMGIIFMIPQLVKMLKGLLGVKEGTMPGLNFGAFFGGVGAGVGGGVGMLSQFSSIGLGISALRSRLFLFGDAGKAIAQHTGEQARATTTLTGGSDVGPEQTPQSKVGK